MSPLDNFFTQMLLLWLFFNECPALLVLVLLVLVLVLCLFDCLFVCKINLFCHQGSAAATAATVVSTSSHLESSGDVVTKP